MPQLPTYQSRALPPVTRMPRAPMRNPALDALARAGATAAAIGEKFGEQEIRLKRESETTNLTSTWSQKLFDYRQKILQSPEFFADPIGTSNNFANGVKSMGAEALRGIKDPVVRQIFKRYWAQEAIHNLNHVAALAADQSNNLSAAQLQGDILRYKTLAEQTPDEAEGLRFLGRALGIQKRMEALGQIKPEKATEDAEKMKSEFAESRLRALVFHDPQAAIDVLQKGGGIVSMLRPDRAAQLEEMASRQIYRSQVEAHANAERANKELATAQNNRVYDGLVRDFHLNDPKSADYDAAIDYALRQPPGLTVDPMRQSQHLANQLQAERIRVREVEADREKTITASFSDWLSGQQAKGDPPSRDTINAWRDPKTGEAAPPEVREKAIEKIGKAARTDRQVEDSLDAGIEDHPFNKDWKNRIHQAYLDGKISEGDKNRLLKKVALWQNPAKSPALKAAKAAFLAKYPNWTQWKKGAGFVHPEVAQALTRFIRQFENLVSQQDLKPLQYQEQADKMLQDVGKSVIASHTLWHPFGGWHAGTAKDFYTYWGNWPEPRINIHSSSGAQAQQSPAPEGEAPELKGVPTADRVRLTQVLEVLNLPITNRNILKLWRHERNGGQQ